MELQSRVHEHRLFFDRLVELIPAKYYIAKDEDDSKWHYGMSKAERAAAKQATKEHLKKAKRDRLDPDKFTSTLHILEQQKLETATDLAKADSTNADTQSKLQGKESRAASYEELRERLHKRMELLRAKRNADAAAATARKARSWKIEKKSESHKRKKGSLLLGTDAESNSIEIPAKRMKQELLKSANRKVGSGDAAGDFFEFGRVKMGLADANDRSKKKRKESKEQLLAKATRLQSDMQDPKIGQDVMLKHSWSAAVNRAAGEKVYDDPARLKQSLKREKHLQQKSSKTWEERIKTVKQLADTKQSARQEHIKERKQQKKEKKIAKREKKLLRPGFEGRRESFINE